MKKKNLTKLFLTLVLISSVFTSSQMNIKGDWGVSEDDCSTNHGITRQYGRYIKSPNITIDGIESKDESWNQEDVYEYKIPMANNYYSSMRFKSYMFIKYIYDDVNLYIKARWNDSTPIDRQDQLFFCWNINCTNFTVSQFLASGAMKTVENGSRVDSWTWMRRTQKSGSQINMFDGGYGYDGWLNIEESNDPILSFTSGIWTNNEGYYQVELYRSLTTNEPDVDIQFEHNNTYRFSTGVGDSIGSNEHAISWTYELDLTNSIDQSFIDYLPIGIGIASGVIIFSIGIIFILIYKIKH